jgi:membrane complex biogenesis BtpA family protein
MTTSTLAQPSPRGLIGVIHLLPMPGDPASLSGGFDEVERHAMRDAQALADGGVNGIIIENFGSSPFRKGTKGARVPAHQVAFMAILARQCVQGFPHLAIGVNCLRNDALSALGVAAASGARFVRVNVHSGAYVTDQGLIEGEAEASLRYRASLRSQAAIFADVLVKHAAPLAPLTPTDAVHDVLLRGHAAGVIVTGRATGAPVDASLLAEVRAAAADAPVWIGSGLTPANAPSLAPFADAAIVGTWLKVGGVLSAPVDPARVRDVADALCACLRKPAQAPDKDPDQGTL